MDHGTSTAADKIASGDISIFSVHSQISAGDQRSLLRLQNIVRERSPYRYLEVGSHVGGSLLPHLLDPRCEDVISIDIRPAQQWDERGQYFYYEDNTTQRMIEHLTPVVPKEAMIKLRTFDRAASTVSAADIGALADLAFIDAEHTTTAVFADFLSVYKLVKADAIIYFHDSNLVFDALLNIQATLCFVGVEHRAIFLPENIFAIAFGGFIGPFDGLDAIEPTAFIARSRAALHDYITKSRSD